MAYIICQNCKQANLGNHPHCSKCGAKLEIPNTREENKDAPETKKCPYCAETIKYEAIVCRYCGRDLVPQSPHSNSQLPSQQNVQNLSFSHSKSKCENCGVEVETRHVEFFQNIGMVFMRRYRTVKGSFCKACIDYYFWSLTGKTMILGWWGVISFFLTPLILLNNLIRFILTVNMVRARTQLAPNPSPFWIVSTVAGFIFLTYLLFSFVFPVSAQPINSQSAISTSTFHPTIITPTPTSANLFLGPNPFATAYTPTTYAPIPITYHGALCLFWTSINRANIDSRLCIYGKVYAYGPPPKEGSFDGWNTIQFAAEPNSFRMVQFNGSYYASIKPGDCVAIYGKIRDLGPYLIISPDFTLQDSLRIFQYSSACD